MRKGNNQLLHARADQQTGFPSIVRQTTTQGMLWSRLEMAGSGQRMIGVGELSGKGESQGFFSF